MTATLARRVEVLEAAAPPPPSGPTADRWPDEEPPDWWALAPVPVRRYALALFEEAAALAGRGAEMGAAWDAVAARLPGAEDLFRLLNNHAERGEPLPLPGAQRAVLWDGWLRTWDTSTGSSSDATAQRYGALTTAGSGRYGWTRPARSWSAPGGREAGGSRRFSPSPGSAPSSWACSPPMNDPAPHAGECCPAYALRQLNPDELAALDHWCKRAMTDPDAEPRAGDEAAAARYEALRCRGEASP